MTVASTLHDAVQRVIDAANNEIKRVAAALTGANNPADVQTAVADLNALADRLDSFDPTTIPETPASSGAPTSSGSPTEPQQPPAQAGTPPITVGAGNPVPPPDDPSQDAADPTPDDPSQDVTGT